MDIIYSRKLAILGFFFISIFGTLSHFVYEWSGNNEILGGIFAVNESTWEHLKIAIIPAFVWLVIILALNKYENNFFTANLASFLTIITTILVVVYGYKAILKENILVLDILTFYVAIALGQYVLYKIMKFNQLPDVLEYTSIVLIVLVVLSFILFTYFPPEIEIFRDPQTNKYGIESSM